MTKWVNVPRCVSYDGLVKLETTNCEQDDNLCNLPTSQPVYGGFFLQLTGYRSIPSVHPSVFNDETIEDEENNQWPDTNNIDDSLIPYVDRGSHDDEDWHDGVGCGSGSVGGHGCTSPSGFATFSSVSFREDEKYTVRPIDSVNFNVKDGNKDSLVNLSEKTCSCVKFEVDKLPCRHALAAVRYAKKPLPDYYGDCYKTTSWVEAYAETIFPVGHPNNWNIPEDVQSKIVLPPPFHAQAGRPRKKRFKSVREHGNGKPRNCTIVKNWVTSDKITGTHSLLRLHHHAHPYHL
ncbi:hypothetical protein Ddye_000692 [Dipteronia dyeriana]|uniref:SWIM-type domain-containing protein n=1 Tax=Dipteronia dyeriana TaxID=168575 RepID=A0AAD9XMS4_9ROSI|nr:hypothetical protein Ddye_000692 [Dipteronia dyeriana]